MKYLHAETQIKSGEYGCHVKLSLAIITSHADNENISGESDKDEHPRSDFSLRLRHMYERVLRLKVGGSIKKNPKTTFEK